MDIFFKNLGVIHKRISTDLVGLPLLLSSFITGRRFGFGDERIGFSSDNEDPDSDDEMARFRFCTFIDLFDVFASESFLSSSSLLSSFSSNCLIRFSVLSFVARFDLVRSLFLPALVLSIFTDCRFTFGEQRIGFNRDDEEADDDDDDDDVETVRDFRGLDVVAIASALSSLSKICLICFSVSSSLPSVLGSGESIGRLVGFDCRLELRRCFMLQQTDASMRKALLNSSESLNDFIDIIELCVGQNRNIKNMLIFNNTKFTHTFNISQ